MTQFNETELTAAVVDTFKDTPNPRVKFLLQELTKSLHAFVQKTDLTFEEWEFAIDFLTRTGQKCTPIRQEFIHVPDSDYRAGRARVLSQFAARAVIFPDAAFAAKYDHQARETLARELASLGGLDT